MFMMRPSSARVKRHWSRVTIKWRYYLYHKPCFKQVNGNDSVLVAIYFENWALEIEA